MNIPATDFASLPTCAMARLTTKVPLWKSRIMKYSDNSIIIKEYRDAFRKYANHGICEGALSQPSIPSSIIYPHQNTGGNLFDHYKKHEL
jgi:hypothetical protein